MLWPPTHVVAPAAIVVLLAGLTARLWRVRLETRAGTPAAFVLAAQALWVVGWIGEAHTADLAGKLRWDGATWIPTVLAMAGVVWVAQAQSGRRPAWLGALALLVVSLPSALWSAYASWRGERAGAQLDTSGALPSLVYPFTWIETGISLFLLLLIVWSAGTVLVATWRRPRRARASGVLLAVGLAGPYVVADLAFLVGATWLGQRDVTPLTFALFAPCIAVAILRGRKSELIAVAREQVVEGLADPTLVLDPRGRLLDANSAARTLLAADAHVEGRALAEVPGAEPLIPALALPAGAALGVSVGRRDFDVRVSLVQGSGGEARVLVLHDVTELRAANRALHEARDELEDRVRARTAEVLEREQTLRAIFDNSLQYMGLLDVAGRMLAGNHAALALLHLDASDVIGRPFWETAWWAHDRDQAARLREGIASAAAGTPFRMLATHPDADGGIREVDFSLTPVRDETGAVHGLVAEGRDLTELRRGEREREALEQQVRHLQRVESVGRLAGGVAHDFNNYLATILGHAELARGDVADGTTTAEELDAILHAARGAAAVTRQLLAIGRRQPSGTGPVDLAEALDRLHGLLGRLLGDEITLDVHADRDAGAAAIDPGPLEQVLINLAINARDAMPTGGTLTVVATAVTLDDVAARGRALSPGRYVRLLVADTGHGMSPEVQDRIFEPFFTTKPEGLGTGLGLAVVHGVVHGAGGHVEVESAPAAGTRFTLFLPAAGTAARAPTDGDAQARAWGTGRVLVVDDREDVRRFVVRALSGRGFDVEAAADGAAALALVARGTTPDLLLCDVRMPMMSGPALVQALRARGATLPVLYMSGQHDAPLDLEPTDGRLEKPFTVDELVMAVRRTMPVATLRAAPIETPVG